MKYLCQVSFLHTINHFLNKIRQILKRVTLKRGEPKFKMLGRFWYRSPIPDFVEIVLEFLGMNPADDQVQPAYDQVQPEDDQVRPADDQIQPADVRVQLADDQVQPEDNRAQPEDDQVQSALRSFPSCTFFIERI